MAVGTPVFMAPEILRGEKPCPQSDLYSLGVVFFRLLTGQLPIPIQNENASLADIFGPCDYAGHLGVSEVRNAYNHNDTNGETVYHIGGYDGWWYTSWLLPGEVDGAVAYHSAGANTSVVSTSSMCRTPKWTNHRAAWTCQGYHEDHFQMKDRFIQNLGW